MRVKWPEETELPLLFRMYRAGAHTSLYKIVVEHAPSLASEVDKNGAGLAECVLSLFGRQTDVDKLSEIVKVLCEARQREELVSNDDEDATSLVHGVLQAMSSDELANVDMLPSLASIVAYYGAERIDIPPICVKLLQALSRTPDSDAWKQDYILRIAKMFSLADEE